MKHVLYFNLPQDQESLELAMNGARLQSAVDSFDEFLRQKIKYTEETSIGLQDIRDKLWEFINETI